VLQWQEASGAASVDGFMQVWDDVVFAESLSTYRTKSKALQSRHSRETTLLNDLQSTWILLKEHFMAPWVDEHLHLGATETSRVEGFHSVLKQCLGVSLSIKSFE
jgi:hypothetical protein